MPNAAVPQAMQLLAKELHSLVNSSSSLTDEEYIRQATGLMYRFIVIHPFPDSNGRTSRALLNTVLLDRDLFVSFTKEDKKEYIVALNQTNSTIGNEYLSLLNTNSAEALQAELQAIEPLYGFVNSHLMTTPSLDHTKEQTSQGLVSEAGRDLP